MISSRKANSTCIVIPIFNETSHLHRIIQNVSKYSDLIVCVNDGSTDGSLEILENYNNLNIITLSKNMGKGKALYNGFLESIKLNSDITITIDADEQHDPALIPSIIERQNNYDVVIGNRMNNLNKMPIQRIASNKITSWLLSKKLGVKILDSQSGFRSFKTSILKDILPTNSGFEAETEMIIKAAKQKLKIGHIDIPTIYNESKSKINPIKTTIGFIKVFLRY